MKTSRKVDSRPSFQFYPDDWLVDHGLRMCGLSARGLWIDLISYMFKMPFRGELRHANRTPLSVAEISRLVSCEQSEVETALKQLHNCGVSEIAEDGAIYSCRLVRDELVRLNKIKAGTMGGLASKSEAEGGPSTPTPSPSSVSTPLLNNIQQEAFDRFWAAYPKKRSKGMSKKAWKKISPSEELTRKMLTTIEGWKVSADWQKDNGQYIPYPATWLNSEGWEDEPPKTLVRGKDEPYRSLEDRGEEKILL